MFGSYEISPKLEKVMVNLPLYLKVAFSFSYYLYRDFVSNVFKKAGPYSIHDNQNPMNFRFPRWVKKIDAAMTWTSDGMTYFFTSE